MDAINVDDLEDVIDLTSDQFDSSKESKKRKSPEENHFEANLLLQNIPCSYLPLHAAKPLMGKPSLDLDLTNTIYTNPKCPRLDAKVGTKGMLDLVVKAGCYLECYLQPADKNENMIVIVQVATMIAKNMGQIYYLWLRAGTLAKLYLFTSADVAVESYMNCFNVLTGQSWDDRHNFAPNIDKYDYVSLEKRILMYAEMDQEVKRAYEAAEANRRKSFETSHDFKPSAYADENARKEKHKKDSEFFKERGKEDARLRKEQSEKMKKAREDMLRKSREEQARKNEFQQEEARRYMHASLRNNEQQAVINGCLTLEATVEVIESLAFGASQLHKSASLVTDVVLKRKTFISSFNIYQNAVSISKDQRSDSYVAMLRNSGSSLKGVIESYIEEIVAKNGLHESNLKRDFLFWFNKLVSSIFVTIHSAKFLHNPKSKEWFEKLVENLKVQIEKVFQSPFLFNESISISESIMNNFFNIAGDSTCLAASQLCYFIISNLYNQITQNNIGESKLRQELVQLGNRCLNTLGDKVRLVLDSSNNNYFSTSELLNSLKILGNCVWSCKLYADPDLISDLDISLHNTLILEKLKKASVSSSRDLIVELLKSVPPKSSEYEFEIPNVITLQTLRQASLLYHPDKNSNSDNSYEGSQHSLLCGEIIKLLNYHREKF